MIRYILALLPVEKYVEKYLPWRFRKTARLLNTKFPFLFSLLIGGKLKDLSLISRAIVVIS